jgi:hypothetical protein
MKKPASMPLLHMPTSNLHTPRHWPPLLRRVKERPLQTSIAAF